MGLKIVPLKRSHNKKSFQCGKELLDNYIQKLARQDIDRDLSACFVLIIENKDNIIGYYTLSANSISRDDFPKSISKSLPPAYQNLPTILLGRLAIDKSFQGKGYGEVLLVNALNRCIKTSENLGALAVVVDPIDENAINFYIKYGFIMLPGSQKMFITIKTIEDSL